MAKSATHKKTEENKVQLIDAHHVTDEDFQVEIGKGLDAKKLKGGPTTNSILGYPSGHPPVASSSNLLRLQENAAAFGDVNAGRERENTHETGPWRRGE